MTSSVAQPETKSPPITFRPGTLADSYAVFCIFEESLADLLRRLGNTGPTSWDNPDELAWMWQKRRPMYEHLAQTADQFWIAEQEGQPIGFARSILRDGLRELTELFVKPGAQSAGAGREFITRVFPENGTKRRCIIASPDMRAQNLYIKSGVYPRFPIYYFGRTPEPVSVDTNLTIEPAANSPETLEILGAIDRIIIEHRRDVDHAWLLTQRQGFLYYRDGQPAGYGYVGINSGPFALLNATDFPAVLAHAENEAARQGRDHFGVEAPTINLAAVNYLLSRGFWPDAFVAVLMTDQPFGRFENYICTSPPFFM
jgi:hypothetical protein